MALNQYIHRDIEPQLHKMLGAFPAVAVTGPRQTGKSTMLRQVLPQYGYITFDDPLVQQQAVDDPRMFLDSCPPLVILDEIQHVPQLTSQLKVCIDEDRERNGRFVLTGSQQFTLMKGLGDSLAGRVALLDLLPFCAAEKARCSGAPGTAAEVFVDACLRGCYPELSVDPDMRKTRSTAGPSRQRPCLGRGRTAGALSSCARRCGTA
jgi:predicted AAA+ superfamily ATPase